MDNNRFIPTIVVPVLDRADMIMTTLDSIAAQTLRPLSVIVVDNGSTDATPEIVSKWIDRNSGNGISAMLLTEPRRGAAIARNTGLRRVESEYVMFFDSDDVMLPGHMERVTKALAERPDADMIRWEISRLDSDGWLERTEHNDSDPLRLHIMHSTYATARFAVRTYLIKESGGWDESLTTWDDLELGTRLLARRPVAIKLSGEPTVRTTVHPDSLTGPSFSSRAEAEIAALDIMERPGAVSGARPPATTTPLGNCSDFLRSIPCSASPATAARPSLWHLSPPAHPVAQKPSKLRKKARNPSKQPNKVYNHAQRSY